MSRRNGSWAAAVALCLLLCAFGNSDATSAARRDANRFILEKLNRQMGEGWQRSGQFFLWTYSFSSSGCDLTMSREAIEGGQIVIQTVPFADVVPVWQGGPSIALYCQSTMDCVDLQTKGDTSDSKRVGDSSILVPVPGDLPKLKDAFSELHRLCDDAYRN